MNGSNPETNAPHPGMTAASPGTQRPCFRMKCLQLTDGGLHPAQIPGNPRLDAAENAPFPPPDAVGDPVSEILLPSSRRGLLHFRQTPTHRQHRLYHMPAGIIRLDAGWRLDENHRLDQAPVIPPMPSPAATPKPPKRPPAMDFIPSKRADPSYDQNQMQAVMQKLDELINALRR
ncbi:MAG: hypothetical protein IPK22_09495 [Verrucomicrobiaceae bacterium]|nr:hypothetical protein [Verrucomicrobiaceae bacterium]